MVRWPAGRGGALATPPTKVVASQACWERGGVNGVSNGDFDGDESNGSGDFEVVVNLENREKGGVGGGYGGG